MAVAGADVSVHAGVGASAILVQTIPARHAELGLDDGQLAALSRLYFTQQTGSNSDEVVGAVSRILPLDQFKAAVAKFVESPINATAASPDGNAIARMVESALKEQTKDKSVVEFEVAQKVADRLVSWAKVFAYFVAVPAAVILIGVSLLGYSKFEDVRSLAGEANTLLDTTKQQLADSDKNRSHLNDLARSLETQLNELKQKSDVISQRVSELQRKSDELFQNVNSLDSRAVQTSAAVASGSASARPPTLPLKPTTPNLSQLFVALGSDDTGQKPFNPERLNLARQCFKELGLPTLLFVDLLANAKYEQKIGPVTDCINAKLKAGQ